MKFINIATSLFLLPILSISLFAQSNFIQKGNTYYFADRVVVKLKTMQQISIEGKVELKENVKRIVDKYGVTKVEQKYKVKSWKCQDIVSGLRSKEKTGQTTLKDRKSLAEY